MIIIIIIIKFFIRSTGIHMHDQPPPHHLLTQNYFEEQASVHMVSTKEKALRKIDLQYH